MVLYFGQQTCFVSLVAKPIKLFARSGHDVVRIDDRLLLDAEIREKIIKQKKDCTTVES